HPRNKGVGVCQRHGGEVAPGPGANSERRCYFTTESPTPVAANSRCLASAPAKQTAYTTHKEERPREMTRASSWLLVQLATSQLVNHKHASNHDQSQSGEHMSSKKSRPQPGFSRWRVAGH